MTEPIDQATKEFAELKWKVGQILTEKFLEYNDGKFHLPVELNPAVHEVTEFIAKRLKQERNKVIEYRSLLESILRLKAILTFEENIPPEHGGEAIAINNLFYKIEHTLKRQKS